MIICYLDAFSGIAGDMTVGALLDAGADWERLHAALLSLNTGASFSVDQVQRRGIAATKFRVHGGEQKAHRHLPQVVRIIERGELPDEVKANATKVFEHLARAEAAVHGSPLDHVHFHEVGAVDSISDIIGACLGFHLLGVRRIACSAINVGSGTVEAEHGTMPVPAPATARLLAGKPVYSKGPAIELTTPTGAALVDALCETVGPMPPMTITASGHGAGDKDFPHHANVLRVVLGRVADVEESMTVAVLEANIDDANPQVLGYAMDRLLDAGALDVTLTPTYMKKGRPGTLLSVIARPVDKDKLAAIIFRETTTLGLRVTTAERRVQPREFVAVHTKYGTVNVKTSENGFAPEYDDCRKLAVEHGVPLREVIAEAGIAYLKGRA